MSSDDEPATPPFGGGRSHDSRSAASLSSDEYSPVHGAAKPAPRQIHRWHVKCSVMSLAISSKWLYVGTETGDIVVYDISTYEEKARLKGHTGSVYTLVLTADKRFLFSGASDSLLKVWDLKALQEVYTIYSVYDIGDVFSAAWVPSTETLFFGSQNASIQWLKLYETSHRSDPSSLPSLRFDRFFDSRGPGGKMSPQQEEKDKRKPNGRGPSARLLEVPPRNMLPYAHYGFVHAMLVTKIGEQDYLISGGGDGTVKIWNVSGEKPLLKHTFDVEDDSVLSLACQESFLFAGLGSGRVAMFDLDTWQLVRVDRVGRHNVMSLAVKDDCLFRGSDHFVSKWDIRQYARGKWEAHSGKTLATVLTEDLKLITGGNDKTVAIWDVGPLLPKDSYACDEQVVALDNENMIKTLARFVAYRTVSGHNGEYIRDCRRCATFLRSVLQHFGAESRLLPVDSGNPIVYGEFKANSPVRKSKKARILFYGHYDVISAEHSDGWKTDPFKLTNQDGYMYGRGVSDNKGPVLAAIYAAAQQFQAGELANDIVFLIEGEEESGSNGFQDSVRMHREVIGNVDWVLLSNSYWLDDNTPCLNYGLRGIIRATLEVQSDKPDLHSGVHGGCFREPTMDMVTLLAKLVDGDQVLIPRFYDSVRKLLPDESKLYDAIAATPGFENQRELLMKKWRYPSLTVHRISVSGPGNSTVIPAHVTAKLSLRIVPDQDIETIKSSVQTHLTSTFASLKSTNSFKVTFTNEADPWIGEPGNAAFCLLKRALREEWGQDPLFIREGGSIPVVRFLEKAFNAKAAQLPCGQASDGAHLDNERLRVTNFFKTRAVLAKVFAELKSADESVDCNVYE